MNDSFDRIAYGAFIAFSVLVAGALVAAAGNHMTATAEFHTVDVIEKHYESEHLSAGTTTIFDNKGNPQIGTSSNHEPEKFILIVRRAGQVESRQVSPDVYAGLEKGQQARLRYWRGGLFGDLY